jgi:signal transduction histidine kinase
MQRQIRQMTRLIDDLLDLARITQGRILLRRDWTSTKSIVSVAIEAVQPMVNERQHQLTVKQHLAECRRREARAIPDELVAQRGQVHQPSGKDRLNRREGG